MDTHIVITVLLCAFQCEPAQLRVWDGDTFRIGFGRQSERVRLAGIDAPEIEGRCRFEIAQAQLAKNRLAELLSDRRVDIVRHGIDPNGRTLATIRVEGRDAGDILVAEGLARQWTGRRQPWC